MAICTDHSTYFYYMDPVTSAVLLDELDLDLAGNLSAYHNLGQVSVWVYMLVGGLHCAYYVAGSFVSGASSESLSLVCRHSVTYTASSRDS